MTVLQNSAVLTNVEKPSQELVTTFPIRNRLENLLLTADGLDQLPEPSYLIDNLLVQNSIATLVGLPGSGKTFVALDWAFCVAAGLDWLGIQTVHGLVLYVAAEGEAGLSKRMRAWMEDRDVQRIQNIRFLPKSVNLLDRRASEELVDLVRTLAPVFVVIDTLARCMPGGEENSSKDMTTFIDAADRIRNASGATVLLLHHPPKDGRGLRGHSSLEGAVQTAIGCTSKGSKITLTVNKQKDDVGQTVRLVMVPAADSLALAIDGGGKSGLKPLSGSARKALRAISDSDQVDGVSAKELIDSKRVVEGTFHRAKDELLDHGLIQNVGTKSRPRWALLPIDKTE